MQMRISLLLLAAAAGLSAQVEDNAHGWYMYFGDHSSSPALARTWKVSSAARNLA